MNAKKARQQRKKAERLKNYMIKLYEIELKEWQQAKPKKIFFIKYFLWKNAKPKPPDNETKHYKKYIKRK